jgi:hypothetical protein
MGVGIAASGIQITVCVAVAHASDFTTVVRGASVPISSVSASCERI